jgi:hypothetical protein
MLSPPTPQRPEPEDGGPPDVARAEAYAQSFLLYPPSSSASSAQPPPEGAAAASLSRPLLYDAGSSPSPDRRKYGVCCTTIDAAEVPELGPHLHALFRQLKLAALFFVPLTLVALYMSKLNAAVCAAQRRQCKFSRLLLMFDLVGFCLWCSMMVTCPPLPSLFPRLCFPTTRWARSLCRSLRRPSPCPLARWPPPRLRPLSATGCFARASVTGRSTQTIGRKSTMRTATLWWCGVVW